MVQITRTGNTLATRLNPYIGTTQKIMETASLIARHAVTHDRIQQTWCNVELSDTDTARLERREESIERRISELVASLPLTNDGPFTVRFDGDPRGYTVAIVAPDGREIGAYPDA